MMQHMDTTYTYVQAQLARRKKQLAKVAADTEISLRTIYYVQAGKDVKHSTLTTLHDYLKKNARKKKL